MRHRVAGRKLNRTSGHRTALRRNLVQSLFQHGQIHTTMAKAKEVRPLAERLITLAKRGDLHARRRAFALLRDREMFERLDKEKGDYEYTGRILAKLFDEIGPRFADRPGGYTRIVRTAQRRLGDGTFKVVLMLVGQEVTSRVSPPATESRRRRKAAAKRAAAGTETAPAQPAAEQPAGETEVAADEVPETETSEDAQSPDASAADDRNPPDS